MQSNVQLSVQSAYLASIFLATPVAFSHPVEQIRDNPLSLASADLQNPSGDHLHYVNAFVQDNLAYVNAGYDGVFIYDITDPGNQELLANYNPLPPVGKVLVADGLAYVISFDLQIIDVSNPASPTLLGTYDRQSFGPVDLALAGDILYVATGRAIDIIDVSDPTSIRRIRGHNLPQGASALALDVQDNIIYVAADDLGIQVVDAHDPLNPVTIGSYLFGFNRPATDIVVDGTIAYVTGIDDTVPNGDYGVHIFDVSDPAAPAPIGWQQALNRIFGLEVHNHIAYTLQYVEGLIMYEVSQPTAPRWYGSYRDGLATTAITLDNETAFLVDQHQGVRQLDPDSLSMCQQDMNSDGQLNSFDVSRFINAFNNQHYPADFNNDGSFNFYDVSAFLIAYKAGCP